MPTPTEKLAAPGLAAQDEDLKDPALAKIRDLIYRISGIFQTDNKFYLLANRCQRRMTALKSGSYARLPRASHSAPQSRRRDARAPQ